MSASKLYPKTYKGREESGGYIALNESRKSEDSPHYRGRVFLSGIGWYWVSGWLRESAKGEMISISLKEISDKEAEQYCAPKQPKKRSHKREPGDDDDTDTSVDSGRTSDIPF
jgi:hypothetical protein